MGVERRPIEHCGVSVNTDHTVGLGDESATLVETYAGYMVESLLVGGLNWGSLHNKRETAGEGS